MYCCCSLNIVYMRMQSCRIVTKGIDLEYYVLTVPQDQLKISPIDVSLCCIFYFYFFYFVIVMFVCQHFLD